MDKISHILLEEEDESLMVKRAIISASHHGIALCQGRLNPAKGDCAFEAAIYNNNDRSCFTEKFSLPIDSYRAKWITEGENIFFRSDFNPGYSLQDWKAGFSQLKKSRVYEVDFFGDFVIPSIAVGMRKILLIFNTNPNSLREPVTVINPAQYDVMPTTEYPIILAYNSIHYESMHPKSDADDVKCIELVKMIASGNYPYSYKNLQGLVDLKKGLYVYQESGKEKILDLKHKDSIQKNDRHKMKDIDKNKAHYRDKKENKDELKKLCKYKKKIKDMDIEERRKYNREKYKERKERLNKEELKNLQNAWKENKALDRRRKRNEDENLFKSSRTNEMRQERAKKGDEDPQGLKNKWTIVKGKQRASKRLNDVESYKK